MFSVGSGVRPPWRPQGSQPSVLQRGVVAAVAALALLAMAYSFSSLGAARPARTDAYAHSATQFYSLGEARGLSLGTPAACPGVSSAAPSTLKALCRHQEQFIAALRVATGQPPRYFVIAPRGGLGNKIRAISGGIKAALATGRQLLVDDGAFPWYHRFFQSPVNKLFVSEYARGGGNGSLAALVPPSWSSFDRARFAVLSNEKAPAWQCLRNGTLDACVGNPPVLYAAAHYSVGHHVDAHAPSAYALALRDVPLTRLGYGAHVVSSLFGTPSQPFAEAIAQRKAELGWDSEWDLRVGFHLRTCVDCGAPARLPDASDPRARGILACARGWLQRWGNGTAATAPMGLARQYDPARILVYVATDDATFVPAVAAALQGLAVVRSLAPDAQAAHFVNTRDAQTAATSGGGDKAHTSEAIADLEAPLMDWWLLGESDVVIGTGSTFGTYAALRRPVPAVLAKPPAGKEAAAALEAARASAAGVVPPAVCGWEAGHHAWVKVPDVAL